MENTLTLRDIDVILESLEYSRMNVTHGDAPATVRNAKLAEIENAMTKLRSMRRALRDEVAS